MALAGRAPRADVMDYSKRLHEIRKKAADLIESSRLSCKGLTAHRVTARKESDLRRSVKAAVSFATS